MMPSHAMSDLGALRADLPAFVLGILLSAAGVTSLALAVARSRGRDVMLLAFGAFAFLYGFRLAVSTSLARDVVGFSPRFSSSAAILAGYWVGLPTVVFFSQLGWHRWSTWLTRLAYVWLAYGLAASTVDLVTGEPGRGGAAAPFLVLASMGAGLPVMFAPGGGPSRERRILGTGGLTLLLFVVNENLGALGVPTVRGIEVYGFAVFVASLGYVAATRVFANERRLVAVAQELETARRIQASILPARSPTLPGLAVAVRYVPMTAVAGDFYDFLPRQGRLGLLVADVSGHGIPAALVASMVKVALEAQGGHAGQPQLVLQGMNGVLCRTLDGPFVTAIYADVEPATGRFRLAGAGHPPALLYRRASGTVEALLENGLLMGFDARAEYAAREWQACPGDRLLLFTDGVLDASNAADELFGLERLGAILRANAGLTAGPLAERILNELHSFRGGDPGRGFEDDVTLAILDFESTAAEQPPSR
jgi:sigma-B regulation protein RsbU (phosphoserine phosphatase)